MASGTMGCSEDVHSQSGSYCALKTLFRCKCCCYRDENREHVSSRYAFVKHGAWPFGCRVLCMLLVASASANAQPTECVNDLMCQEEHYCGPNYACLPCQRCEYHYNREPNTIASACIKSASDCGLCLQGYSEWEDGSLECVSSPPITTHGWIAIIVALCLTALILCIASAFVLRNIRAYKLLAAINTLQQADTEPDLSPPPPYNNVAIELLRKNSDEACPRLQMLPSPTAADDRETDCLQNARVFNLPSYEREGAAYVSYEAMTNGNHNESLAVDDRVMHVDSHNINAVDTGYNVIGQERPMDGEALAVPLLDIKSPRVRQSSSSSNEKAGDFEDGGYEEGSYRKSSFTTHNQSPFIINVIKNITTVQQHNDLTV